MEKLFNVDTANNISKEKREKKGEKNKYTFKLKNKWTEKEFTIEFNYLNDSEFFKAMKSNYFNNELLEAFKTIKGEKVNVFKK